MVAVPELGRTRPSSIRSVVVLPAPLGPRKPVMRPGSTEKDRESTAVKVPKRLVRLLTSIRVPSGIMLASALSWGTSHHPCVGEGQPAFHAGPRGPYGHGWAASRRLASASRGPGQRPAGVTVSEGTPVLLGWGHYD